MESSQIEDCRLAASQLTGVKRRIFEAAIITKYCDKNARKGEQVFGWGRETIRLGLREKQSGIFCTSLQKLRCGNKRWEERYPSVAGELKQLAEKYSQQDPTFRTTETYTRLTIDEALLQLKQRGYSRPELPSRSCMGNVLNRMGYRLKKVVKSKPLKKDTPNGDDFCQCP